MPKLPDGTTGPEASDADETFLGRWSRRKRAGDGDDAPAAERADAQPAPALTDADMPPLETLTTADDFSPFMAPGVSDRLRNLALRKLFGDARFNIRDGLDDYDDDYRTFETVARAAAAEIKARLHGAGQHGPGAQERDRGASSGQVQASADAAGADAPPGEPGATEDSAPEPDARGQQRS